MRLRGPRFRDWNTWLDVVVGRRFAAVGFLWVLVISANLALFGPPQLAPFAGSDHNNLEYSTAVGEIRTITLPDNTTIRLNTNSRIIAQYSRTERHIELTRGEALFVPAHNDTRAFSVSASNYRIRDIGTRFDVRVGGDHNATVLVTEGRVAITPGEGNASAAASVKLESGEEGIMDGGEVIVRSMRMDEIDRRLAWQSDRLVFNEERLDAVVTELNRYNRVQIVITDPSLLNVRIGGGFRTDDDPLDFAKTLEYLKRGEIGYEQQGETIRLFRRPETTLPTGARPSH